MNSKILEEKLKALEKRNQQLEFENWYLRTANTIKDDLDKIHDAEWSSEQKISSMLEVLMRYLNLKYIGLYLKEGIDYSESTPLKIELHNQDGTVYNLQSEEHPFLKQLSNQWENWIKEHNITIDLEKVKDEFYPIKDGEIFILYLNTNEEKGKTFGAIVGVANRKLSGVEKKLIRDDWEKHVDTRIKLILGIQEDFGSHLKKEQFEEELIMELSKDFVGAEPKTEKKEEPIGYERNSYFDKFKTEIKRDLTEIIYGALDFNFVDGFRIGKPEEIYPKEKCEVVKFAGELALELGKMYFKYLPETRIHQLLSSQKGVNDIRAMVFMAVYGLSAPYLKDEKGNPLTKESNNIEELTSILRNNLDKIVPQDARQEYKDLYRKIKELALTMNDRAEIGLTPERREIVARSNLVEAAIKYASYCYESPFTNGNPETPKRHSPGEALNYLVQEGYEREANAIAKLVLAKKQ